jgi:hypothetical protein
LIRQRGSTAWYRGHRRNDWELKSTLHRHIERMTVVLDSPLTDNENKELLRGEEKSMYRRFKKEAWPLLRPTERSNWGVVFTMQHYRLPTRLLDWTESFACGLFFAQWHRRPEDTATVWVLDSEGLNEVSLGKRGVVSLDEGEEDSVINVRDWHPHWVRPMHDLNTIAVAPLFTNPRMTAQKAAFTLAGDSFLPLENQFDGRLVCDSILVKIELPPKAFDEVEQYLRLVGVGPFTYFPDLEGLALDHEARAQTTVNEARKILQKRWEKE